MRVALLIAGLAAGYAASAGADLPRLPTVTLPTVTLPTVTLPTVTLPTPPPPVPPVPPPPPVHLPPAPPPPAPPALPPPPSLPGGGQSGATQRGGAGGATGSGAGAGGATGATGAAGAPAASAPASRTRAAAIRVYRLRTSRDWIAKRGPKRQRHTTLVFVLRNPSLVRFVVVQISPDCRRYAHFRVVGHRGVNRVRLGPRVGRHTLRPGTYKLIARAVPGGRTVVDTRLVVVRRANRDQIQQARGADTCPSAAGSSAQSTTAVGSRSPGGRSASHERASERAGAENPKRARHQGVLGAKFARKAVEAARSVPVWLYALLVLAIVLLGMAALPLRAAPTTAAASALARHRGALAAAGAATLVAVMVMYVLL